MKKALHIILLAWLPAVALAQHKAVLPVNDFEKAIQAAHAQVLDVRTPGEFREGFIPGAVNADWQDEKQFTAQVKRLDKSAPVYVYCLSGGRSGKAADWLLANGFTAVNNLEGGIKAWKAAHKKITVSH